MPRQFNEKEVEAMCTQSYMRGMMVQYETMAQAKRKPRRSFNEWLKDLIKECPLLY